MTENRPPDTGQAEPDSLATGGLGRWLRRWLFRLLMLVLGLVLLLAVIIGGLLAALHSETGTAWVLKQIPGLETVEAEGSLLGEWQAAELHWHGFGVTLALTRPYVDWSPTCLFGRRLCVEALRTEAIDLAVVSEGDSAGTSSGPIELPVVRLPLTLEIREVALGTFDFNGTRIWETLLLKAQGSGTDWHLETLQVEREDLQAAVSGRFDTRGDWPLALDLALVLPPPYGDHWQVDGTLSGSVRNLRLSLVSRGYLDARLEALLGALDPALPARVTLTTEHFLATETLPRTLALNDVRIGLDGNLNRGYELQTEATLPGEPEAVAVQVRGRITAAALENLRLALSAPGPAGEPGLLEVAGQVSWQEGLQAAADIRLDHFPWFYLLPDMEAPPVSLERLQASLRYDDEQYEASLTAAVDGPQGEAELETEVHGDLEQVTLNGLRITTGAGSLTGSARVGFAGPVSWQAELALNEFNPGYWLPEAEASISGDLQTEGTLTETPDGGWRPDVLLGWNLNGEWQTAPLTSEGRLTGEEVGGSQRWTLGELTATVGDNRLAGQGHYDGRFEAELTLDVPDPDVLMPGLSGSLQSRVVASGDPAAPVGEWTLAARDLRWQKQLHISEVDLTAELLPELSLDSRLQVTNLVASGQRLEQLLVSLEGSLEQHRLELTAEHREVQAELAVTGSWQDGAGTGGAAGWLGQIAEGVFDLPRQRQQWLLDQAAAIRFVPGQTLTLGSHCWRWQDSAFCSGEQTLLPDMQIALSLERFPTAALSPLLPETLRWRAELNGEVDVVMDEAGPRGSVHLAAGPGRVAVILESDWETLDYEVLDLTLDMVPDEAELGFRLQGDELGELTFSLTLDPAQESLPVAGNFSLTGFDLALVGGLLDMEEISGSVHGEGRLEGPLMNPEVFGEVRLEDGYIVDPSIPLPMEQLQVLLSLNGRQAVLDGHWSSQGASQGHVDGALDWQDTPTLTLTLEGDRLPVTYEPYAHVEVSPALTVTFADGELAVSGRVAVPSGEIRVRELPESAVSVSGDEVIIGEETEPPMVRAFNMDVQVLVGEERVAFSGFGVTGNLEGALRVANDLDTRGTLQMVEGRYKAFGQELELRRARLVFVGPVAEPYLEIEAVRYADPVVAGIRLTGPASEPQIEVFSEPPMPQNEALSYVILGRPLHGQGEGGEIERAALSLGLAQTSGVTRGIGEGLGIRDLTLGAEGSGDQASVVASGYLTDELSIRYGVGLFEPITTVALRYDLGRYFYVEAASGLASSIDLFYTRNF